MKTFGIVDFNSYLEKAKEQICPDFLQHVIMGNESADLDSIVSACVYGYFLDRLTSESKTNFLPLVNIPSTAIRLRPEAFFLFSQAGASMRNLVCRDFFDAKEWHDRGQLRLTLIDHNELAPSQEYLADSVVEIIDHHEDGKHFQGIEHRVIEPVGSTATLVAEQILRTAPQFLDAQLAILLLGAILLDTVDLDPAKGRCHEKDIRVGSRLLRVSPISRTDLFEQLLAKRSDLSPFDPQDLLLKDFKVWDVHGIRFGITVIPTMTSVWLKRDPALLSKIKQFSSEMSLNVYLIMAFHVEPEFGRELIGYSPDKRLLDEVFSALLEPLLDLQSLPDCCSDLEGAQGFLFYVQGNTDISRKRLVPKLKDYFSEKPKYILPPNLH